MGMKKSLSGATTNVMEVGKRVGKQILFHSCKPALSQAVLSTVTLGMRPGARTQLRSTVIRLVIMEQKNGVKSGVNQASRPGARSGHAASLKT